ncbi:MAG: diguanylate cyclase [Spirochaetes bacterium]|nr:diguanylate cyclase [Spirochaetota bacterium]
MSLHLIYKGFKAPMVRATFLFCASLVIWLISGGLTIVISHLPIADLVGRVFYIAWVLIPISFLNVVYTFRGKFGKQFFVFGVVASIFVIMAMAGIIHEVHYNYFGFYPKLKYPWGILINAYYFSTVGFALALLYIEYSRAKTSIRKNQALFLWLGASIGFMLNISETCYLVSSFEIGNSLITTHMHVTNFLLQLIVISFYVFKIVLIHRAIQGKTLSKLLDDKILLSFIVPANILFSFLIYKYGYPLFSWGRIGILIAFSLLFYAILKYRLIDLNEILLRLLVYLFLSVVFFGMWVIFVITTADKNTPIFLSILYGLLIIALFNPLHIVIQRYIYKLAFPTHINYQKTLMDLSMKIVSVLDYHRLIEIINDTIVNTVGSSTFAMLLHDEESDNYIPIAVYGVKLQNLISLHPMHDLLRFLRLVNEEVFRDVLEEENASLSNEIFEVFDYFKSTVAIPMVYQGYLKGVLFIGERKNNQLYTRRDIELLKILANHILIAIDNARLYELAIRDGLTRLYIPRFFHQRIFEEILNSIRWERPLSLLMIDIDHFKSINDNYGHQIGDQVLKKFAQVLSEEVRENDIVARYGGEEFSILLPETDNDQAMAIAERIRTKIQKTEFDKGIRRTASVGIATFVAQKAFVKDKLESACTRVAVREKAKKIKTELIKRADDALYVAKRAGRNMCTNGGEINILQ